MSEAPLTALLQRAPEGVEVRAGPNQVLVTFHHQRGAPIRVRADVDALTWMILGAIFGWIAIAFGLFVAIAPLVPEGASGLLTFAFLAFLVAPIVYIAAPKPGTEVEVELLPGELRIERWRCQLRDITEVRYVEQKVSPKRDPAPADTQHSVDLRVGDVQWRMIPSGGRPVAAWVAALVDAARLEAVTDDAQPPPELVEIVDGDRS